MSVRAGHIYRDDSFYVDRDGVLRSKFLLVLAVHAGGDIVARLLTSRHAEIRPENPHCFHGDPYPSFFLGVLGGVLGSKTWLDLRSLDDLDGADFARRLGEGRIRLLMPAPVRMLRAALECAANADDTTRNQERAIRDAMTALSMD
jgi:hypothetical protein